MAMSLGKKFNSCDALLKHIFGPDMWGLASLPDNSCPLPLQSLSVGKSARMAKGDIRVRQSIPWQRGEPFWPIFPRASGYPMDFWMYKIPNPCPIYFKVRRFLAILSPSRSCSLFCGQQLDIMEFFQPSEWNVFPFWTPLLLPNGARKSDPLYFGGRKESGSHATERKRREVGNTVWDARNPISVSGNCSKWTVYIPGPAAFFHRGRCAHNVA